MPKSTRTKGQEYVRKAIKMYEEKGWSTWKPGSKATWIGKGKVVSQSQDIFEVYDFIAKKRNFPFHLVQVTTMSTKTTGNPYDRMKKIDAVEDIDDYYSVSVVMAYVKRKGFNVWLREFDKWTKIGQQELLDMLLEQ